jgi:hypothetical protein
MDVPNIYTYEDNIMNTTKHFEKGDKGERGHGNIMKGVKLFKVHCMHIWNFTIKSPCNIIQN